MKKIRRILAIVLATIMVIGMVPTAVFATEVNDYEAADETVYEEVNVTSEEKEAETTVEDISEETQEAPDASSEQETEPAGEAVEEVDEAEAADAAESEPKTLKAEGKDYVVTVSYTDAALLPEDVRIDVQEIKENAVQYGDYCDQALEAVQNEGVVADELSYVRFFDIRLVDTEGNKAEPAEAVDVQIRLKDVESADDNTQVVHFGSGETEVIAPEITGDTLSFETEGFSIYAVVTTGENARLTVNFVNGTDTTTMYVKKADIGSDGEIDPVILYDPGAEDGDGKKFMGWSESETYTEGTVLMTIDDVRDDIEARLNSGVTDGDEVTYYAIFHNYFHLFYENENGITFKTEYFTTTNSSIDVPVNTSYATNQANKGFLGWAEKEDYESDPENCTVYVNTDTITLSADLTLVPVIENGYWLYFDENDGGSGTGNATYTPPVFIAAGKTAADAEPDAPTRPGYSFAGWYTQAVGGTVFDFAASHLSADTTVFAHWSAVNNAKYKVIIWKQKVTDHKDAADSQKTYDYSGEIFEVEGTTGATITDAMLYEYTHKDYTYRNTSESSNATNTMFEFNRYEIVDGRGNPTTVIGANNDTVVNVYYDRALFTIYFYTNSNKNSSASVGDSGKMTGLYDQPLSMYYSGGFPSAGTGNYWYSCAFLNAFTGNLFGSYSLRKTGTAGVSNEIHTYISSGANTDIYYYLQDKDDATEYDLVGVTRYNVSSTNGYLITDRITGATPTGYKWSTSASAPDSWTSADNVDSSGRTSEKRGNNTYLHIKYDRVVGELNFIYDGQILKTVSNIPYEQSLLVYEEDTPEVTPQDGYYFAGWYEDEALTKPFDWENTVMPLGGKFVYAKVLPEEYHVVVEPNGGSVAGGQSLSFWVPYQTEIDDTNFLNAEWNGEGEYSLIGWYKDSACTVPYNFKTRLTRDSLTLIYTGPDDPQREEYGDDGYDSTTGVITLYAKWRDDSIAARGGIRIRYTDADGNSGLDPLKYADAAEAIVAAAPTTSPEGQRFDYWSLNGQKYYPGDKLVADKSLAHEENVDGSPMLIIDLAAVYVETEDRTPTHVTWYKNDGTGEYYHTDDNYSINEAINIYAAPTRDGYEFLGWAKDTEQEEGSETINTSTAKTTADFLEYKDGKYYIAGTTTEAVAVAADEVRPYEALYAIWKRDQYHIYHSATGETEDVDMPDTGTAVLTGKVTSGYLYGGYYAYTEDGNHKGEFVNKGSGMAMTPEAGETYYLKEVDPGYLKPNIYLVYSNIHNGLIQDLYGFVNIDDQDDYTDCGLIVGGSAKSVKDTLVTDSITVTRGGEEYAVLTPDNLFGQSAAVFGYANLKEYVEGGATVQITGYYVTKDNVRVTGYKDRMIRFAENDATYGAPVFTGWTSAGGNTKGGLKSVTPTMEAAAGLTSAGMMSARRMMSLAAPVDQVEYTITKVYDTGAEEQQTVQEGNHIGEITYTERNGYLFAGWYKDQAFTEPADFSDVQSDLTVYARYVSKNDISLTVTRKSQKSGSTTFNTVVTVKDRYGLGKVGVNADGAAAVLSAGTVKKTGSGKNVRYTTQYNGTVSVKGLSVIDSFAASVSWTTPDGTAVTGPAWKCTYILGIVTVR